MKPAISCCMIVKNEEAFLEQCLESVKGHVDEIVIVDTGSTDGTVDIARRFTDRVYFHPWEDSFAKARNQSLSYAQKDWIFIIDADEELLPGNGPLLREAVANAGDADALTVNIISIYDQGRKTSRHNFERIFRNRDDIRFVSTVHNRLVGAERKLHSGIELMHYGYNHEEKVRNEKFRRTAGLLRKQIEEEPENPLPHHYLGASYLSLAMLDECIEESLLAIELAAKQGDDNTVFLWSHYNASFCLLGKGEVGRAEQIALRALGIFPDHLDSHYILTLAYAKKLDWEKAARHGRRFLELLDFYNRRTDMAGMVINCTLSEAPAMHTLLGHAFHSFGDARSSLSHYEQAYELSGKKFSAWVNAADYHMELTGELGLAREFLERAKREAPEEKLVWVACAKLSEKSGLPNEEKECLKKVFRAGTDEVGILKRLALLCMESGEHAAALEALDAAGRLAPADYAVLVNKGRMLYRLGDVPGAVEAYSRALECGEAAADPSPWDEMGEICLGIKRLDDAEIFFERTLAMNARHLPALLKLCEIRLLRGDIAGFVGRCDSVMKLLGMRRDRVLNSMADIAVIVMEIDAQLRDRPDLSATVLRIMGLLGLLPGIDYKQMLMEMKSGGAAKADEFTLNRLELLANAEI
jgi:glycosyltransferase involved in cell wall biosynthesis/Flp pilus assembly protein TadD